MKINLPWVAPINTLNLPDDFKARVRSSFKQFTEGTSKEYQFEDKLLYLDNLRQYYLRKDKSPEDAIKTMIGDAVVYQLDNYGESLSADEILSTEFMEAAYEKGFRPLRDAYEPYSSSDNTATLKVILDIVKIIVNYSDEATGGINKNE